MNYQTQLFIYMVCNLVLFLKVFVTNYLSGKKNTKANLRLKEDYIAFKIQQPLTENDPVAKEEAHRWQRIVMNDIENIPLSLVVFWGAHFCAGHNLMLIVCIIVFTSMRVAHSVIYAKQIQPYRTVVFLLGLVSVITAGVIGVIEAAQDL